jgi:hypothetical protein
MNSLVDTVRDSPFSEKLDAFNDVEGRTALLVRGDNTDPLPFQGVFLHAFDLFLKLLPHVEQDLHPFVLHPAGGHFPVSHMGHEDNRPFPFFDGLHEEIKALADVRDLLLVPEQETVQEDIGEVVILPPGAPEMITPAFVREKRPVETDADDHTGGKEEEVSRGDEPGKEDEYPDPRSPGKGHQTLVKKDFHA